MNKTELIAAAAEGAGLTKKDTERGINAAIDAVTAALVKGDKVQVAHLRDIPSPAITHVPALVKFIGVTPADSPVTVDTKTSYLAVSSLIGRVLETNYFGKPEGEVPLKDLLKDLPQTHSVSENANAKVVNYKGKDYVKMDNKDWREYAK
mgnify:CR=1 FL=1